MTSAPAAPDKTTTGLDHDHEAPGERHSSESSRYSVGHLAHVIHARSKALFEEGVIREDQIIDKSRAESMATEFEERQMELTLIDNERKKLLTDPSATREEKKLKDREYRNKLESVQAYETKLRTNLGENKSTLWKGGAVSDWFVRRFHAVQHHTERTVRYIKDHPLNSIAIAATVGYPLFHTFYSQVEEYLVKFGQQLAEKGFSGTVHGAYESIKTTLESGGSLSTFGALVASGGIGYVLGGMLGWGIDHIMKKRLNKDTHNSRWMKYVGAVVGGLGTAVTMGIPAASVFWSGGASLALLAVPKLISGYYNWGKKRFDVEEAEENIERHDQQKGKKKTAKRIEEECKELENIYRHTAHVPADGDDIIRALHEVDTIANAVVKGEKSLAELEHEWHRVKALTDKKIEKKSKEKDHKTEADDVAKESKEQLKIYRRAAILPENGTGDGADEIVAKLEGIETMVRKVKSGDASFTELEAEWKRVKAQVEKAIEKKHTKEDKKMEADEVQKESEQVLRMYRRAASLPLDGSGDGNDEIVAKLKAIETMVQKVKSNDFTYAELEAEWKRVKEEAERVTQEKYEVAAKHTPLDIKKVQFFKDEITKMLPSTTGSKWSKVPGTPLPDMPADLKHDLEEVQDMITNFESAAPRYTRQDIENKFNAAQVKFNTEFEDATKKHKEKEDAEKVWEAIKAVPQTVQDNAEMKRNPAARSALREINDIYIKATNLHGQLERARTAGDAKRILGQLEKQQTLLEQKVSEAKVNAEKATLAAEAIKGLLGNDEAKAKLRSAMSAIGNLPGSLRKLRDVVQKQSREVKEAMKENPINWNEAEKKILDRNSTSVIALRAEIDSHFAAWKDSPITPGTKGSRFIRDFNNAFKETPGEKFYETEMESFVKNADENLETSTAESMDKIVIALMQLKNADGQNLEIDSIIKGCSNPSGLPNVSQLEGLIKPYLPQSTTP
ncbi:hypothetical protein HY285_01080 [Candidatus Peregrinibacteria bacterium]|nr:hypothetical protein [Candidatus Peregrinibacteria bacterium]MBI3816120.1 hypothetical protein [Candidatus Peregrinibacteria bacterium]